MSDELDEVETIRESLSGNTLPVWWRIPDEGTTPVAVEQEKATVRDVADVLIMTRSDLGDALRHLENAIAATRKDIRRLENHRHELGKTFSQKPEL